MARLSVIVLTSVSCLLFAYAFRKNTSPQKVIAQRAESQKSEAEILGSNRRMVEAETVKERDRMRGCSGGYCFIDVCLQLYFNNIEGSGGSLKEQNEFFAEQLATDASGLLVGENFEPFWVETRGNAAELQSPYEICEDCIKREGGKFDAAANACAGAGIKRQSVPLSDCRTADKQKPLGADSKLDAFTWDSFHPSDTLHDVKHLGGNLVSATINRQTKDGKTDDDNAGELQAAYDPLSGEYTRIAVPATLDGHLSLRETYDDNGELSWKYFGLKIVSCA